MSVEIDSAIANDINNAIYRARDIAKDIASGNENNIEIFYLFPGDIVKAIISINHLIELQIFDTKDLKSLPEKLIKLQAKIPDLNASPSEWDMYADKIDSLWLKALEIRVDPITFSDAELFVLGDYLYSNDLLLRCQRASIGISRKEWESIEERLLKI